MRTAAIKDNELVKAEAPVVYLKPTRRWSALNLRDLWMYRELIYFLTWRDVKVRYKQSFLGVAWAILQPLLSMVIFTVVFGKFIGLGSEGQPYELFSFTALLPWTLFAGALQRSSMSLVGNSNLLTKIYFPRLVIPISAVVAGLIDFAISFCFLVALLIFFHVPLSWNMLWLPLLILLAVTTALAVGLWLSALNVQYRDIQHMVPFLVQAWMYASPVVYSIDVIDDPKWRILFGLNPMAGVIQGFRWAILGSTPPNSVMWVSVLVVLVLLVGGLFYFKHMERTFADTI